MKRRKFLQSSAKVMVSTAFLTSPFTSVFTGKQNRNEYVVFAHTDKKGESTFVRKIYFPKNVIVKNRTIIYCKFYEIEGTKKPDSTYLVKYTYEWYVHNKKNDPHSFKLQQLTEYDTDLDPYFKYLNQLIRIEFHERANYVNAYYKEGEQKLYKSLTATSYFNANTGEYFELEEDFRFVAPETRKVKENEIDVDEDCFLTSACVFYKGLPDNCSELQILRNFRDGYMANSAYGKSLINDYYEVGPKTVQAIYNHPQKAEIFEFIYNKLVLKSVSLIKRNEYELAMEYYKIFTEKLRNNLAAN